ncbi:MAG: preprotein translocase subunit SecE [Acidothermaceae bacterium]
MSDTTTGAAPRPERRPARPVERGNAFARIGLWWRQIVNELRKVIWPTRKELVSYTIVTVVFSVVVMAIVFFVDYGTNWSVLKIWG